MRASRARRTRSNSRLPRSGRYPERRHIAATTSPRHDAMFKTPYSHRPLIGRLQSSPAGRALLSLAAIGAVASVGALATRSTFTDQVTMAQISVAGGAL